MKSNMNDRRWLIIGLPLMLWACDSATETSTPEKANAVTTHSAPVIPSPVFVDIAHKAGLDFEHFIGASGEFYLPEIMGPGVALIDYDNDGDLDIYVTQGIMLDDAVSASASTFPPKQAPGHRLFRNDLDQKGEPKFTDVTATMGVTQNSYGMGVATGDIDNDGYMDLYVTQYGNNQMFKNNGDGTFNDIADAAGANDSRWSTSAAFFDYDRDGDLDLFVANYVDFSLNTHQDCIKATGESDYCTPENYQPLTDKLFRNDGAGHYTDVSKSAGIDLAAGPGLGVAATDLNGDGWLDLYVANDMAANYLWINGQDGTFDESGLLSGVAFNKDGRVEASMGVAVSDFDSDGDDDLFITHLNKQTNTLYVNNGHGQFIDQTDRHGLGSSSLAATGFGTAWFDVDNDGDLDLFAANGGVIIDRQQVDSSNFPYAQRNQLFVREERFIDVTHLAGAAMTVQEVSRAAAFGDIDNDGDIDVVVSNCNGPLRLLQNRIGQDQPSLSVRLKGTTGIGAGAGARVALEFDDGSRIWRRVSTDGSYLSASSPAAHFGLGKHSKPQRLIVQWPGNNIEIFSAPADTSTAILHQGLGTR